MDFDDGKIEIQENVFLTFDVADESYGIDIRHVTEIIRLVKITPIPEVYDAIKGVINLRGKIIPVMDIRLRIGLQEREYDDRSCVIVMNATKQIESGVLKNQNQGQNQNQNFDNKGVDIGIIVDRVSEVLEIPKERMEPAPKVGEQRFVFALGKMNEKIKILLDINKLLFDFFADKTTEIKRAI
ncbi:MAG: chemotaxis protein CheW [Oligoflexia bacterium]|nr:chemotaxis protein CheW [Oligoflexia bacterium]